MPFVYNNIEDEDKWKKIVDRAKKKALFKSREDNNNEVPYISYNDWKPSFYGACQMTRLLRSDGSYTNTGYIECGSELAMRVQDVPQDKTPNK